MKRIHFFSTKDDIRLISDFAEKKIDLKYISTRHHVYPFHEMASLTHESARDIENLGIASASQTGSCEKFVVVERSTTVSPEITHIGANLPDGGKLYTYYSVANCANAIEFNAGGEYRGALINGLIQTWSDAPGAQKLMRLFLSAFKKEFNVKVGVYWIGPEAYEFLKNGGRLTHNFEAGSEFDLRVE